MRFKLGVFVLIIALLLPAQCFAAGKSNHTFLGFSTNQKYCAFETYGYYDGSGFPYSKIFIIDVDKNSYVVSPTVLIDSKGKYTNVDAVRKVNLKNASNALEKYNIKRNDFGNQIFRKPLNNYNASFKVGDRKYNLRLIEKDCDDKTTQLAKEKIFELQLIKPDKKVRVLQKDVKLPKSRGYAFSYKLLSGYRKGNKVAIFVEYAAVGFEGPDFTQLVVTGTIE